MRQYLAGVGYNLLLRFKLMHVAIQTIKIVQQNVWIYVYKYKYREIILSDISH